MRSVRAVRDATARPQTTVQSPKGRIAAFYGVTLLVSWTVWAPWVLTAHGLLHLPAARYLHLVGSLGPAIAALLILVWTGGRKAVRELARRSFTATAARQAAIWSVGVPTLVFLGTLVVLGFSSHWIIRWNAVAGVREYPALAPPVYALASLLFYGFGEEVGWRGLLYPLLRQRHRPLPAALLVVPFWAIWHLPLFFAASGFRAMGIGGAAGWLVSLVSGSLLTSWLTDRARGSILPAAVLHAVLDVYFLADVGVPVQSVLGAVVTLAGVAVAVIQARRT